MAKKKSGVKSDHTQALLELQNTIFYEDEEKFSALLEQDVVKQALKMSIKKKWGSELLCLASDQGNLTMVQALMAHGAKINGRDNLGQTPLYAAVSGLPTNFPELAGETKEAHLDTIRFLVDNGAKTDDALTAAEQCGYEEVLDILSPRKEAGIAQEVTPNASENEPTDAMKARAGLLALSCRNASQQQLNLMLHMAAVHGKPNGVKTLLEQGAGLECKDRHGFTALHAAAFGGQLEVVNALLAKGANPSAVSGFCQTPLHFAAKDNHPAIATALLRHDADAEAQDHQQNTPLHLAAAHDSTDIATVLLNAGANIEARSKVGGTPLFDAVFTGHPHMARFLLDRGADVNARDNENNTPLHIAAATQQYDSFTLLLTKGADREAVNANGHTPDALAMCARMQSTSQEALNSHRFR